MEADEKEGKLLELSVVQQTCGNICTAFTARLERVWVVTGPIFDAAPQRLRGGVEVPAAEYRILNLPLRPI